MTNYRLNSVSSKFFFWFFIVGMLPLIAITSVLYFQWTDNIKKNVYDKLLAVRDLKVAQINNWLDERKNDMKILSEDIELIQSEELMIKNHDNNNILKNNLQILKRYLNDKNAYSGISIINASNGISEISTDEKSVGRNFSNDDFFKEPLKSGDIYIKDIFISKEDEKPSMILSAPLYSMNDNKRIFAILTVNVNLENSLYELLLNDTGMGKTGETLIVNSDVVALNELKGYRNAVLNLHINAQAALRASRGETGIMEVEDYRGVMVLAAFTYIQKMGWGFVAKQDIEELYGPINLLLFQSLIILVLSMMLIIVLINFITNWFSKPIKVINGILKEIETGGLFTKIPDSIANRKDEFGSMSKNINVMLSVIETRIQIRSNINNMMDTLINITDINDYSCNILTELVKMTSSDLGAVFSLDGSKIFHPVFSIGLDQNIKISFDMKDYEGDIGIAYRNKQMIVTKNTQEFHTIVYKTFLGSVIPEETITIPVIINNEASIVISLARMGRYTEVEKLTLDQIRTYLNSGFLNVISNEKIRYISKELECKNADLENKSIELGYQSAELSKQNEELKIQKKEIMEANRLKTEFLSNISHELKTPLNSVNSLSKLLITRLEKKSMDDEIHYLEIILKNGQRLLELINNLLDIAKIESNKKDIHLKNFDIVKLTEEIIESFKSLMDEKKLELIVHHQNELPLIYSDEKLVYHVLQNLMSNAVKFTEQGVITIKTSVENEMLHVSITDTGIGISEENLPIIFDEFRQVDGSFSRKYEGTGLGLAIANKTIKLIKGRIDVESKIAKGSTFTLVMPVNYDGKISDSQNDSIFYDKVISYNGKKTVFLVEDNEYAILQIKELLETNGFNVGFAQNGETALKYLKENLLPDIIILDLMMPGIDGFEFLDSINNELKNIPPVIVMTAKDMTDNDLQKLYKNKIQHIVQKGNIDTKLLLFKINAIIENI